MQDEGCMMQDAGGKPYPNSNAGPLVLHTIAGAHMRAATANASESWPFHV